MTKPLLIASLMIAGVGCASSPEPAPMAQSQNQPQYVAQDQTPIDRPPREVLEIAKKVVTSPPLSMTIDQDHDGLLVTGWQQQSGEWHIARRWQERTRYTIRIFPDWNEPMKRAKIDVASETQTRATDGQRWTADPELSRPERAQAVLQQIKTAVGAK